MRTVELLEEALEVAQKLGYRVRHEWLGGVGGGACEFAGRRWVFVDLALNTDEQLEQVVEAIKADPGIHLQELHRELGQRLEIRRAA